MVESYAESFLKFLQFEKRYSRHSITSYQNDLNQFQAFLEKEFPGTGLQVADHGCIRSWLITLANQKLEPSSINRKIACLRSFYKFLMREEVLTDTPMRKVRLLKTKKRLPHFVKEQEIKHVLDDLPFEYSHAGTRERLILELFYGTGIRLSELIGLKEKAINKHDQTIKVLGKRNKERVIPIGRNLVKLIEEYRVHRNREIKSLAHDHLLVADSGAPLYPMLVNRIVKRRLRVTGSEKKSPHVLRHTYATHLLDKGAEINAVKDLLGHSSLAATQVYTHNTMEKLKKVFEQAHPKA